MNYHFGVLLEKKELYRTRCMQFWESLLAQVVRRGLVVTFAAISLQGSLFKTRPGQKFEVGFLFHAHPMIRLWDHNIGYQSQSHAWNSPSASEESIEWVQLRRP